jgi:hypothetical protein
MRNPSQSKLGPVHRNQDIRAGSIAALHDAEKTPQRVLVEADRSDGVLRAHQHLERRCVGHAAAWRRTDFDEPARAASFACRSGCHFQYRSVACFTPARTVNSAPLRPLRFHSSTRFAQPVRVCRMTPGYRRKRQSVLHGIC